MQRKKVAVIKLIGEYLPLTETFIYSELVNITNYEMFFYARAITNEAEFPFNNIRIFNDMEELKSLLICDGIDIIHARFGPSGIGMIKLKKELGVPLLTSFHGFDVPSAQRPIYTKQLLELFQVGDMFTTTSNYMRDILIKFGCNEDKVLVQNSGIDLRKFSLNNKTMSSCNRSSNITILTIGRLIKKKGMEYLIEAINRAQEYHPEIELRIVGDGDLRRELTELVNKLNIHGKVKFLGSLTHDRVVDELKHADIFALTSVEDNNGNQEGIPNVLKEAMACGLPIISTWHAGIPELVKDGECGFLVPEKDSNAIVDVIVKLLRLRETWSDMGKKGREIVKQSFNVDKQILKLERVYEFCIHNKET